MLKKTFKHSNYGANIREILDICRALYRWWAIKFHFLNESFVNLFSEIRCLFFCSKMDLFKIDEKMYFFAKESFIARIYESFANDLEILLCGKTYKRVEVVVKYSRDFENLCNVEFLMINSNSFFERITCEPIFGNALLNVIFGR